MGEANQALHCEISKLERIGHPVRHEVQQLFADGYVLAQCRWQNRGKDHSPSGYAKCGHTPGPIAASVLGSQMSARNFGEVTKLPRCVSGGSATYSLGHQRPNDFTDGPIDVRFLSNNHKSVCPRPFSCRPIPELIFRADLDSYNFKKSWFSKRSPICAYQLDAAVECAALESRVVALWLAGSETGGLQAFRRNAALD